MTLFHINHDSKIQKLLDLMKFDGKNVEISFVMKVNLYSIIFYIWDFYVGHAHYCKSFKNEGW